MDQILSRAGFALLFAALVGAGCGGGGAGGGEGSPPSGDTGGVTTTPPPGGGQQQPGDLLPGDPQPPGGSEPPGGGLTPDPGEPVLRAQAIASSAQCPQGGVLVDQGLDANANGVLDDAEVASTEPFCDGSGMLMLRDLLAGQAGAAVAVASSAAAGAPVEIQSHGGIEVVFSDITPGPECPGGGRLARIGFDGNDSGVLESGEAAIELARCFADEIEGGEAGADRMLLQVTELRAVDPAFPENKQDFPQWYLTPGDRIEPVLITPNQAVDDFNSWVASVEVSPDGRTLLKEHRLLGDDRIGVTGEAGIALAPVETPTVDTQLLIPERYRKPRAGEAGRWSPGGRYVALKGFVDASALEGSPGTGSSLGLLIAEPGVPMMREISGFGDPRCAGRCTGNVGEFAWSPDETRIAYAANVEGGPPHRALYLHTLATDVRDLVDVPIEPSDLVRKIRFAPDGKHIAVLVTNNDRVADAKPRIYLTDGLGGSVRQVFPAEPVVLGAFDTVDEVIWSPDGRYLTVTMATADLEVPRLPIHNIDVATGEIHTLPSEKAGQVGRNTITWSPDGRFIAYSYSFDELRVSSPTGEDVVDLFPLPEDGRGVLIRNPDGSRARPITWSDDMRWMTFSGIVEDGGRAFPPFGPPGGGTAKGFIARGDGRERRRLPVPVLPLGPDGADTQLRATGGGIWQPGGSRILYGAANRNGFNSTIVLYDVDTAAMVTFTGDITDLGWSPSGNRVALGVETVGFPREVGVLSMRPDGRGIRLFLNNESVVGKFRNSDPFAWLPASP